MAVSAYDAQGRLKKHTLLGTSLAVDPDREVQRRGYQELYDEARGQAQSGGGRNQFLDTLSNRYGQYEQGQSARLNEIARQQGDFDAEYAKMRDPEAEKKYAADIQKFQDWTSQISDKTKFGRKVDLSKFRKWKQLVSQAGLTEAEKTWNKKMQTLEGKQELIGKFGTGAGKQAFMRDYILGGEQRAKDAQTSYFNKLNSEVDRINSTYIPLQTEQGEVQQRLADRVDLYNLFLGQ